MYARPYQLSIQASVITITDNLCVVEMMHILQDSTLYCLPSIINPEVPISTLVSPDSYGTVSPRLSQGIVSCEVFCIASPRDYWLRIFIKLKMSTSVKLLGPYVVRYRNCVIYMPLSISNHLIGKLSHNVINHPLLDNLAR